MRMWIIAMLAASSGAVVIGPGANGTTVRVAPNSALVVRLPGNVTTGFSWTMRSTPAGVRLTRTSYQAPKSARIGQGGTFVFHFEVTAPRRGLLRIVYARPWEKTSPAKTFTVRLRPR